VALLLPLVPLKRLSKHRAENKCRVSLRESCESAAFAERKATLKNGSSTNEVRGAICALHVLALIDDVSAATEPERLTHISLGQENPRMRMNAAQG